MDEYDALYNQSYGDLNPDTGDFGDGNDMFAELQKSILGNEDDSGSMSSYSPAGKAVSKSVYDPVPNGLDPKITKIVRAIREVESGGNYNAKGASGEFGAYQFMPSSWKQWAGEFLGDSNAPMTKENQNQVAYKKIESLAKQGHTPDQIASIWNSGQAKYDGKVGVNKYGVAYDVPAYVKKVMSIATMPTPTAMAAETDPATQMPVSQETMTPEPQAPEKKSVGGFIKNLGTSTLDFGKGLANIVIHPIDTIKNIGSLGIGTLDNIAQMQNGLIDRLPVGDGVKKVLNTASDVMNPVTALPTILRGVGVNLDKSNAMADAVGRSYVERYGGVDNIGNTLYKDPIGVAADLATLLSGGAGAASKLGAVGKLGEAGKLGQVSGIASKLAGASEVASGLSKAAKVVDPLTYLAKGKNAVVASKAGQFVKDVPFNAVGLSTGQGGGTFKQIYDAAKAGRGGAVEAMRGGADEATMVSKLDNAVSEIGKLKQKEWNNLGLDKMGDSLDISPVTSALEKGLDDLKVTVGEDGALDFSRARGSIRYDKNAQSRVNTIVDSMRGYGLKKGDRLPSSIDDLKQSFASLYYDASEVKGFVEKMRKSTRDVLGKVKGYDEYTKNYGELSETIAQLKHELSAGSKNASTTWRKVVNTFKQRNTEGRQAIMKTLLDKGVSDLIDNIAGYGAKDWLPSDIVRGGVLPNMSVTSGNLLSLPAFSPRAIGETVNLLGKTVKGAKNQTEKASNVRGAGAVQYLGGQIYNKNKATRTSTLIERMKQGQEDPQQ